MGKKKSRDGTVVMESETSFIEQTSPANPASGYHKVYPKNDGKLYIGAGRYVASVEELTTFVPATAGTFTYTVRALDLPENFRIKCLAELGNNLEIGTWSSPTLENYIYNHRVAVIFPWDRSSSSFGEPISLEESGRVR